MVAYERVQYKHVCYIYQIEHKFSFVTYEGIIQNNKIFLLLPYIEIGSTSLHRCLEMNTISSISTNVNKSGTFPGVFIVYSMPKLS